MKLRILTLLALAATQISAQPSQQSWMYGGLERAYIQYVPPVYDGSESVPVVFCFHGLGDNMQNFYNIGMNSVADTANFITIFPQAILDPIFGTTAWNSGAGLAGFYLNQDVDDVGFIMSVLDTLASNYNIDMNRIYATGFSMGGFFTNRLACEHSEVFEAVASVAGTLGEGFVCDPTSALRIAHFHGTADNTVGYDVNTFGMNVPEWISFWQNSNGCSGDAVSGMLDDIASDGFTIEYSSTENCADNSEVAHYRVNNADHVWLTPLNDIFYTTEIWRFFLGVQPAFSPTGFSENTHVSMQVYPNPSRGMISIESTKPFGSDTVVELVDVTGKRNSISPLSNGSVMNLDLSGFNAGTYVLRVISDHEVFTSNIILN